MIDDWPTDENMSERCGCGHTLGQHEYGLDLAPCEHCDCRDFHDPTACAHRAKHPGPAGERCARHALDAHRLSR